MRYLLNLLLCRLESAKTKDDMFDLSSSTGLRQHAISIEQVRKAGGDFHLFYFCLYFIIFLMFPGFFISNFSFYPCFEL